jgi:hypothetical protein
MEKISFIDLTDKLKQGYVDNLKRMLYLDNISFYNPIYEKYDKDETIHQTIKSKYTINCILESSNNINDSDNSLYVKTNIKAETMNNYTKRLTQRNLFVKFCPIINPLDELIHFEEKSSVTNHLLPSNYIANKIYKINNFQNRAYIDAFFCSIGSKMTETGKCPTFPAFLGTFSCIKNDYLFDLTDDYSAIKYNRAYQKNMYSKKYEMILKDYIDDDDDDEDSDDEIEMEMENIQMEFPELDIAVNLDDLNIDTSELETNKSPKQFKEVNLDEIETIDNEFDFEQVFSENDDKLKYIKFSHFPVQCIIQEKLEYTLDELHKNKDYEISTLEWTSILFQICFGLAVAQKRYNLVHNDLHCDNIIFQKTS